MNYQELIHHGQLQLRQANANEQDAIFLLMELSKQNQADFYANYNEQVPEEIKSKFLTQIKRLQQHEPLDYILGYCYFYGYSFIVNQDVLIPRDETQELVANVLSDIDHEFKNPVVIDVGCGSGAIAISLKKEEPSISMYASDISEKAIAIARKNAELLDAEVNFLQGNMLDPFIEQKMKVDIIVSNPPYIAHHEKIQRSVYDYEPHIALFANEDGLAFYREIFQKAKYIINEKALIAVEMGYLQKDGILKLARENFPNAKIEVVKDLNNKDRMLFVYINQKEILCNTHQ